MVQTMVMRSIYLDASEDADLRQLAHALDLTKSDLIRSAIRNRLADWRVWEDARIIAEVTSEDGLPAQADQGGVAATPPAILHPPSQAPDRKRTTPAKAKLVVHAGQKPHQQAVKSTTKRAAKAAPRRTSKSRAPQAQGMAGAGG